MKLPPTRINLILAQRLPQLKGLNDSSVREHLVTQASALPCCLQSTPQRIPHIEQVPQVQPTRFASDAHPGETRIWVCGKPF
jgi:hypothetical protein